MKNEMACLQGIMEIGLFHEAVKKTTIKKLKNSGTAFKRSSGRCVACECKNRMAFLEMQVFIQNIYDHSIVKKTNRYS